MGPLFGFFTHEALEAYQEALAGSESVNFAEGDFYDFTRCVRPDGTAYASSGKCRKGTEQAKEKVTPVSKGPSRSALPEYWQERAELSEERYNEKLKKASVTHMGTTTPHLVEKMKPYTKLSGDEKAAVQMYGAAGVKEQIFDSINMKLRTGAEPSEDKKAAVEFTTVHLKSALEKLPDTEGEFHRAVSGGGAKALQGLTPGSVITDNGFGSYSDRSGPNISPFFDRTANDNAVMVVKGKTFKNVSPVMPYQEGEHLSRPGTQLRLVNIRPQGTWSRKLNQYVTNYEFEEV
jgi:hypothetical protein